jgi:hypothetical protein
MHENRDLTNDSDDQGGRNRASEALSDGTTPDIDHPASVA